MLEALALRLHPGQDLKVALDNLVREKNIQAACVITCVGSLTRAVLRFADQPKPAELDGPFEIVSLTGTLSTAGTHCHIAIADRDGKTFGAHLLEGCQVYTTAEIVLGILPNSRFLRSMDQQTGYEELQIIHNE